MKVGDYVAITTTTVGGRETLRGKAKVTQISPRQITTFGGLKWCTRTDPLGYHKEKKPGYRRIRLWTPEDDVRLAQQKLIDRACKLFDCGSEYRLRDDFRMLSDEDLRALGDIAERLKAAQAAVLGSDDDEDDEQ